MLSDKTFIIVVLANCIRGLCERSKPMQTMFVFWDITNFCDDPLFLLISHAVWVRVCLAGVQYCLRRGMLSEDNVALSIRYRYEVLL